MDKDNKSMPMKDNPSTNKDSKKDMKGSSDKGSTSMDKKTSGGSSKSGR